MWLPGSQADTLDCAEPAAMPGQEKAKNYQTRAIVCFQQ